MLGSVAILIIMTLLFGFADAWRRIFRLYRALEVQKDDYERQARAKQSTLERYARRVRELTPPKKPPPKKRSPPKPKPPQRSVWDRIKKPDL